MAGWCFRLITAFFFKERYSVSRFQNCSLEAVVEHWFKDPAQVIYYPKVKYLLTNCLQKFLRGRRRPFFHHPRKNDLKKHKKKSTFSEKHNLNGSTDGTEIVLLSIKDFDSS